MTCDLPFVPEGSHTANVLRIRGKDTVARWRIANPPEVARSKFTPSIFVPAGISLTTTCDSPEYARIGTGSGIDVVDVRKREDERPNCDHEQWVFTTVSTRCEWQLPGSVDPQKGATKSFWNGERTNMPLSGFIKADRPFILVPQQFQVTGTAVRRLQRKQVVTFTGVSVRQWRSGRRIVATHF